MGARKANEIVVVGYGSDRPIASNSTPEGMALNRRVEITLLEDTK
jgi:outer membrane protein OmpA-like peptidoglycan-associated protein